MDRTNRYYPLALLQAPADLGRLIGRIPITVGSTVANTGMAIREIPSEHMLRLADTNKGLPINMVIKNPKVAKQLTSAYSKLRSEGVNFYFGTNDTSDRKQLSRVAEMEFLTYPNLAGSLLVDTGGKEGWDQMSRRTETMFVQPNTYADAGAEVFVKGLTNFLQHHPDCTVTLVAHSMGSIVANEIIRRHGAELHLKDVVYMAAACGVQDFAKCVVPVMQSNTNIHFYNLCLSPINDRAENHKEILKDAGPIVEVLSPHGSLLQWIDDYYSNADTKFGWTMGKFDNVVPAMQAAIIPPEVLPRISITCFGTGHIKNCGPQRHGDFTTVTYWDTNFWMANWTSNMVVKVP